jgi:tRNA-dihydrouridine synthase B
MEVKTTALGPFQLDHPFILAPMAGITNSPFRRLMRRLGSSLVVSELVSATGMEYGGSKTLDLLRFHEEERVVGLQIFGEDTDHLCRAAQKIEQMGADFVDLNMGCPVPKVVKKGAGAALSRDPVALGRLLSALVASVRIPVSIKIRTGWDASTRNALEVVSVAQDAGVAWVAIHGRTRAQGYSGEADWEFIGTVKAKSPLPIIGNGDLWTPELAVERVKTYGVDAVLIGRGALRNPFIFEQARALYRGEVMVPPSPERYLQLLADQQALLAEVYEPRSAMIHARKFLAWYSAGFPGCHEFRSQVFSMAEPEELWQRAFEFFQTRVSSRSLEHLSQPFLMGGHG